MTEVQLVLATLLSEWRFEREYDGLDLAPAVTLKPETDVEMTTRRWDDTVGADHPDPRDA